MRNRNLVQLLALTDLVEKTAKSLILVGELVEIVVPAYRSVPEAVGELLYSRRARLYSDRIAGKESKPSTRSRQSRKSGVVVIAFREEPVVDESRDLFEHLR